MFENGIHTYCSVRRDENYKQLNSEEKAVVKTAHKKVQGYTNEREGNLAWGFMRGFPYRRIERTTRIQVVEGGPPVHHNLPNAARIAYILKMYVPSLSVPELTLEIKAWLKNPEGAIPAPIRMKLTPEEARARHEQKKVALCPSSSSSA